MVSNGPDSLFNDWRKRFDRLRKAVRKDGDPEAVHDLRVVCRRLQELTSLLFPRGGRAAVSRLRETERALSPVRNQDIFLEFLRARSSSFPSPSGKKTFARLMERARRRRKKLLKSCRRSLDRSATRRLRKSLKRLHRSLREKSRTLSGAALDRRVGSELRRMEARLKRCRDGGSDAALHELRKAVRRTRFSAEIRSALQPGRDGTQPGRLKGWQDRLGRHHDALVTLKRLDKLARRFPEKEAESVLDRLRQEAGKRKERARATLREALMKEGSKSVSAWTAIQRVRRTSSPPRTERTSE